MTQKTALDVIRQWEQRQEETSGALEWENIRIQWETQLENCVIVNGGANITTEDSELPSSITYFFEISIDPK